MPLVATFVVGVTGPFWMHGALNVGWGPLAALLGLLVGAAASGRGGAGALAPDRGGPVPSRPRQRLPAPLKAAGLLSVLAASGWGCAPPAVPVGEGDHAPRYSGALLDGGTLALAELRGEPVLLNLWATWCAPCR